MQSRCSNYFAGRGWGAERGVRTRLGNYRVRATWRRQALKLVAGGLLPLGSAWIRFPLLKSNIVFSGALSGVLRDAEIP